jgi:hypothetical protein
VSLPKLATFATGQFLFVVIALEMVLMNTVSTTSNNNCANIFEWFAPVVNIVGHIGLLAERHGPGMPSFDMRCTSYNHTLHNSVVGCDGLQDAAPSKLAV